MCRVARTVKAAEHAARRDAILDAAQEKAANTSTAQRVEMGPEVLPPFQKERQVMFSFSIAFFKSALSRSLLTPTRENGLPSSLLTSDRSCGYMARQGGHQFPQKSSSTTFPL